MSYRVQVYETRWVGIIQTGDGDRWIHGKAKRIEQRARIRAPKRSGRLASSHVTLPTTGSNQYQKRYRISAMAPYAHFVHGGTGIYGPAHRPIVRIMSIPASAQRAPYGPRVIRHSRGQRPQPWLEQAARDVLGV
ncbi:hypothetical protein SEA_WHEELIE_32 [Microbacterium phage Wheelie]|nr:hypothetical protein SEA_CASEND_34 [Microbacterium phage Casend]QQO39542.1 hypothetical protein SEA_PHABIA_33 [Microbacterium phage Phabia]QWY80417.1 hypothetical protein SEA_TEEHEE_34 [Microbacterium phage Teehee]QXN73428.1 hypothetical protein SEA_JEHOSHAPHAT_35 [Microbacterium phage Jehoshaphat]UVG33983.1 hypothetical protein SEA_WHEELIE_32 [Microbacterium phage Wheelie]WKW84901.1 hypothetical protein SEA_SALLYK_34 [Microbacterium phage SallyK]WNM75143.1 hypothetical protein SEA_LONELYS